jgi:hypothetical protein
MTLIGFPINKKTIHFGMGYSLDVFLPDIHPKVQMTITATF